MGLFFKKKEKKIPTVTFATSCWERDWSLLLNEEGYLQKRQISPHLFLFAQKMLVINNVKDLPAVKERAQKLVQENVLTHVYAAEETADEVLSFFSLKREDFRAGDQRKEYGVEDSWVYYNAIGVLSAIYHSTSDYILYHTGDVWLPKEVDWIEKAISLMEKNPQFKVANLTWNENYREAKKESYRQKRGFYLSKQGFSDQLFLVRREDFRSAIYGEIRPDSSHYPRGDVFEKRVFSYMKNRGWERLTYAKGSYYHECFEKLGLRA
jgi:hypothetical protein